MNYLQLLWFLPFANSAPVTKQSTAELSSHDNTWIVGTYRLHAVQAKDSTIDRRPLVTDRGSIIVDTNPHSNNSALASTLWIDGSAVDVQSQRLLTKVGTELSLVGEPKNGTGSPGWAVIGEHLTYPDVNGLPDDLFVACPYENYKVYAVNESGCSCRHAIPLAIHASKID